MRIEIQMGGYGGLHLIFSDQRLNYAGFCVFEECESCQPISDVPISDVQRKCNKYRSVGQEQAAHGPPVARGGPGRPNFEDPGNIENQDRQNPYS